MRLPATFTLSILLSTSIAFGQTRLITGKIITESFDPAYEAKVFSADTLLLVTADIRGNFKIEVPIETKLIMVGAIGAEWKNIDLSGDCGNLDIILLRYATYDFVSARKVDRLRKKDFSKLPALHQIAFEKGIFKSNKPCYVDRFVPIKKKLNGIHKSRTQLTSS